MFELQDIAKAQRGRLLCLLLLWLGGLPAHPGAARLLSAALEVFSPYHLGHKREQSDGEGNADYVVQRMGTQQHYAGGVQAQRNGAKKECRSRYIAVQPMTAPRIQNTARSHPHECKCPNERGSAGRGNKITRRNADSEGNTPPNDANAGPAHPVIGGLIDRLLTHTIIFRFGAVAAERGNSLLRVAGGQGVTDLRGEEHGVPRWELLIVQTGQLVH